MIEGPNVRDEIGFCAFHSFHASHATYMRGMRNNNLEIRIAGSSCRLQQEIHVAEKEKKTLKKTYN